MEKFKLMLIMFILVCISCQSKMEGDKRNADDDTVSTEKNKEVEDDLPPTNLKGTTWKLNGIVNTKTGQIKKLEPADCEACYSLLFDTDYSFTAIGVGKRYKVDFLSLTPNILTDDLFCERYDKDGLDYCDADDFRKLIPSVDSFSVHSEGIRLYTWWDHTNGYLSFIPHEGDNPSTSRRGTIWKLSGIVNIETGEIKELEPVNCEKCYQLHFSGDYKLSATSIWAAQLLDLLNLDIKLDPGWPWGYENDNGEPLFAEIWAYDPTLTDPAWNGDGKIYEDSYLFRCGIAFTEDYEFTQDALKLFFVYKEKKCYLLFKLVS